jgi:hypothetical protein
MSVHQMRCKGRIAYRHGEVVDLAFGTGKADRGVTRSELAFDQADSILDEPTAMRILTDHENTRREHHRRVAGHGKRSR